MLRIPRLNVANAARLHACRRSIATTTFENNAGVSELSLIVAAGSRDEPAPGVAHVLQKFAFQDTKARSGLRLQREAELIGGQLKSTLHKEHLVLTAQFLREDLPYFVEALASTVSTPLYREYQFHEEVVPLAQLEADAARKHPAYVATEAAHEVAFRSGLGNPVLVNKATPVTLDQVVGFGSQAFAGPNLSLFGRNVSEADLKELAGTSFAAAAGQAKPSRAATKTHSGESRTKQSGLSSAVLAFPGAPSANLAVLQYVLGGHSVKWSPSYGVLRVKNPHPAVEVEVRNYAYSDASLLALKFTGACAKQVSETLRAAAEQLKALAKGVDGDLAKRAIASARFAEAEAAGTLASVLAPKTDLAKVTPESLTAAVKQLTGSSGKRVLAVAGQTQILPYLDELF